MQNDSWQPTASPASLQKRSEILWALRSFFHDLGMSEVHTPILGNDTVLDRHIDPIVVPGSSLRLPESDSKQLFLQTSPEFGMKRLLAAGMNDIYQISPVFRAGERGNFHNPEFTMVEWYRSGDNLEQAVDFLGKLICEALDTSPPLSESYEAAFLRITGCNPFDTSLGGLARLATDSELNVDPQWSQDRDDWLDLIFSELIQPQLGVQQPSIITHYPASQSALARICAADRRTAERFELFIDGVELANGYHELLDAHELQRRNELVAEQRRTAGQPSLPIHSRLVDAMRAGMPACSGCALGLDRLIMVATQADSIDQVLAFPIERA